MYQWQIVGWFGWLAPVPYPRGFGPLEVGLLFNAGEDSTANVWGRGDYLLQVGQETEGKELDISIIDPTNHYTWLFTNRVVDTIGIQQQIFLYSVQIEKVIFIMDYQVSNNIFIGCSVSLIGPGT